MLRKAFCAEAGAANLHRVLYYRLVVDAGDVVMLRVKKPPEA